MSHISPETIAAVTRKQAVLQKQRSEKQVKEMNTSLNELMAGQRTRHEFATLVAKELLAERFSQRLSPDESNALRGPVIARFIYDVADALTVEHQRRSIAEVVAWCAEKDEPVPGHIRDTAKRIGVTLPEPQETALSLVVTE